MVTRSQAKRKADESLAGHRRKATKSSQSDDSSVGRDRSSTHQQPQSATGADLLRQAQAGLSADDPSKTSSARNEARTRSSNSLPAAGRSLNQDDRRESTRLATDNQNQSSKTPLAPLAGDRKAGSVGSNDGQRKADEAAHAILRHLDILLARRRVFGTSLPSPLEQEQRNAFIELEALAQTLNTDSKRRLEALLPQQWWWLVEDAEAAIGESDLSWGAVKDAETELVTCSDAYDAAVATLDAIYLGLDAEGASGESTATKDDNIVAARRALRNAKETYDTCRDKEREAVEREGSRIKMALDGAERALAKARLVPASEAEQPIRQPKGSRANRESVPSQPDHPASRGTGSRHGGDRPGDTYRPSYQNDIPAGSINPAEAQEVQDIVEEAKESCRERLRAARAAQDQAEHEFDRVRTYYYTELDAHLRKADKNAVKGTKSDYDRTYFLARNAANHALARADEEYQRILVQAEEMDAVDTRFRVDRLGDNWDDGVSGVLDLEHDLIWQEQVKDIESWKKQVEGGRPPSEPLPGRADAGKSLDGFSELEYRQSLAQGRRRRQIDFWKGEQEHVRAGFQPAFPIESWDDTGLLWFQLWDGI